MHSVQTIALAERKALLLDPISAMISKLQEEHLNLYFGNKVFALIIFASLLSSAFEHHSLAMIALD
jgi:hypothetical protein